MYSDFSVRAKYARAHVSVPEAPIAHILERSDFSRKTNNIRGLVLGFALSFATIGAAAAFAPHMFEGARIWLSGDKVAIAIGSLAMVREPTITDLQRVAREATFPVVLPGGLPAGTRITRLWYSPATNPNLISVDYQNTHTHLRSGIALFDGSAVDTAAVKAMLQQPHVQDSYRWTVGRENVVVLKRTMSAQDARRIQTSMKAANPATSLAWTRPMLPRATIVGLIPSLLKIATRYAPATGHTVVVGPKNAVLVPELAKDGKPLLDTRTVYLSDIPTIHGQPDYAHATLRWPRMVAISAAGVHAIDTAFRANGIAAACGCIVLFSDPGKGPYTIWEFSQASVPLRKFSVDTRTFAVTTLRVPTAQL